MYFDWVKRGALSLETNQHCCDKPVTGMRTCNVFFFDKEMDFDGRVVF